MLCLRRALLLRGARAPGSCILGIASASFNRRASGYVQGQSSEKGVREYFYFIDHQGQLFLDDARMKNFTSCFKEHKFLAFFFSRLRVNSTDRYRDEFPWLSPCGPERNYVRCDDQPIVFTHLHDNPENADDCWLLYNHCGDKLKVPFQPGGVCMHPSTGRVYHPADSRHGGVGLIRSQLAIQLATNFVWRHNSSSPSSNTASPTHFCWRGAEHEIDLGLLDVLDAREPRFRGLFVGVDAENS